MDYIFEETKIPYLRLAADEWLRQEETTDLIVPDSSPDASAVCDCCGLVTVRSTMCQDGSIQISGGIQAVVFYQAEGETTPRVLETYMPFALRKDLPACQSDSPVMLCCRLTNCDARVLNSRKILLRADIGCSLQIYQKDELIAYTPPETEPRLQLLRRDRRVTLIQDAGEKVFAVDENVELPPGQPPIERLLCCRAEPQVMELRAAGSKALFKGIVHLHILYLSEENSVSHWTVQLPFSQYCDLYGNCEEGTCRLLLQLAGCEVNADSPTELTVNLMYQAQCTIAGEVTIPLVEDAYHLTDDAAVERKQVRISDLAQQTVTQPVKLQLNGNLQTVQDCQTMVGKPEVHFDGSSTQLRCSVRVRVSGQDEAGNPVRVEGNTAVVVPCPGEGNRACCADLGVYGDVYVLPGADMAEIRFTLDGQIQWQEDLQTDTIQTVHLKPRPTAVARPSVIVRHIPSGTDLWNVAKQAGSTVKRIRGVNGLETDTVEEGMLLLIPIG